jgi:hypothetical protein
VGERDRGGRGEVPGRAGERDRPAEVRLGPRGGEAPAGRGGRHRRRALNAIARAGAAYGRSIEHMKRASRTLLAPGHEAEWAEINREEADQVRASNLALTPAERLEQGQRLSQQAVSLLAASVKAGHVPRRALRS